MSAAVEVFEVGFEQLRGMLDSGFVADCLVDGETFVLGCYALVECASCFDYVQRPRIAHVFSSESYATRVANEFFAAANCWSCFAHDYEVWHVVDDAELWQVWEHDVAVSKRRCNEPTGWHVYRRGACVLDTESVPTCLYRLRCVGANCEGVSDEWYTDAHCFAVALGVWVSHGWVPWHSFVRESGDYVTIVDDDFLELDDYGDGTVLTVVCRESC